MSRKKIYKTKLSTPTPSKRSRGHRSIFRRHFVDQKYIIILYLEVYLYISIIYYIKLRNARESQQKSQTSTRSKYTS